MNYQRKSYIKHELSEIYHELSLIAIFEKLTLSNLRFRAQFMEIRVKKRKNFEPVRDLKSVFVLVLLHFFANNVFAGNCNSYTI
jgi:hypothetical protein